MFSEHEAIKGRAYVDLAKLFCHEQVVEERLEKFLAYLKSLETLIILPSILVCDKTYTIIDGHHRYHALKSLGFEYAPVTWIDYDHYAIIPHLNSSITKQDIIRAALEKKSLLPKSSYHHFLDQNNVPRPLILLSFLSDMKRTAHDE